MQPLIWERRPEGLRAPALICAFKGWNDAANAASTAVDFLGESFDAQRFAAIDPEEFYDFQATRPIVRLSEGRYRDLIWPETLFREALAPRASRDLILLSGDEPSYRWRTYCGLIVDLAEAMGVQIVVTLGALLADVAHTRPVSITGLASDDDMARRLGLGDANYEGPSGITAVLHSACADAGIPSASLWATVPHYVAAAPNPKAALALVRKLEGLVGVTVDASELESATTDYEHQVDRAVQSDPDVQEFVERLEAASDTPPLPDPEEVSGDQIANEFQRFLRQRGAEE